MSDSSEAGILYTEHSRLKTMAPGVASLWSFETRIVKKAVAASRKLLKVVMSIGWTGQIRL